MLLLPMLRLVYLDALVTMCWYSLNMFEGLQKLSTIKVVPTDMNQKIVFVEPDGGRIAYATIGDGPPLVKAANYQTLSNTTGTARLAARLRVLAQHHT